MLTTSTAGWLRPVAGAVWPLALVLAIPALLSSARPGPAEGLRLIDVERALLDGEPVPFCRAGRSTFALCQPSESAANGSDPLVDVEHVALPAPRDADERALTFLVDGDLVIDSPATLAFALTGAGQRDIHIVVIGDVRIADDLLVDEAGAVRLYAVRDRATGHGGNVLLHDPRFDTLSRVDAEVIASGRVTREGAAESAHVARAIEGAPLSVRR